MDLELLKYPAGEYAPPAKIDETTIAEWIVQIERLPEDLRNLVENLSYANLGWHYRPNGWTIQQVVHHLADSHMNSFIRFKLSLTENTPTVRPIWRGCGGISRW